MLKKTVVVLFVTALAGCFASAQGPEDGVEQFIQDLFGKAGITDVKCMDNDKIKSTGGEAFIMCGESTADLQRFEHQMNQAIKSLDTEARPIRPMHEWEPKDNHYQRGYEHGSSSFFVLHQDGRVILFYFHGK